MDKKQLVVCAIFENEAAYLPEWLAYHHLAGVEHFVLYDNGSTDDPARAIRTASLADDVTLIPWPQRPGLVAAYRHFIDVFAPGFEWAAFLDVDEFLLPLNGRKVGDTLDWLSNAAAVLVHRRVFGPEGWQAPPPGLVIENYDRRAADDYVAHRHVRPIVRSSALLDVAANPRAFRIDGPVFNTAGHLAPNDAVQAQPCYQNLVINHYYTRSRQDWLAKLQRNAAVADGSVPRDAPGLFDELAAVCHVPDATIQAFAPAVRAMLGRGAAGAPAAAVAVVPVAPALASGVAPTSGVPVAGASVAGMPPSGPPVSGAPVSGAPVSGMPMSGVSVSRAPTAAAATEGGMPRPAVPAQVAATFTAALMAHATGSPAAGAATGAAAAAVAAQTGVAVPAMATAGIAQVSVAGRVQEPEAVPAEVAVSMPVEVAVRVPPAVPPNWMPRGPDAQERAGGLALVVRDRSRAGEHWLAALRGAAAAAIDPAFLLDDYERIRDFPTDAEAREACDTALARKPGR